MYGYDIQTKAEYHHLTVFSDSKEIHYEFVPQVTTINKEYYFEIMKLHCEPDASENKPLMLADQTDGRSMMTSHLHIHYY